MSPCFFISAAAFVVSSGMNGPTLDGFVVSDWPAQTSLLCGREYTSVSTITIVSAGRGDGRGRRHQEASAALTPETRAGGPLTRDRFHSAGRTL